MPANVRPINRRRFLRGAAGLGLAVAGLPLLSACGSRLSSAVVERRRNVVVEWNNAALQAIRTTKPGPPMVARMLAVLHTSMYDAWAMYDAAAKPTAAPANLRRPAADRTLANKEQAVSVAAYRALSDLFPTQQPSFDRLMADLDYRLPAGSTESHSPAGIGSRCAQAVLDYRHTDGSNQLGDLHPGAYSDCTDYQPVNTPDSVVDPSRWQPLRVPDGRGGSTVQQYIGPHWGLVKPFAMRTGSQFRPDEGPATFGTDRYVAQANQLLEINANLTDRQKVITEYWADGPNSELPPGHWCLFGQYVSKRDHHDLDTDVKMFFLLTNALLDAGIACWDAKRCWDSVRPVTAVRYLYRGQKIRAWGGPGAGTQSILGEYWLVYQAPTVITPAFPEFFSGHSTFSAASAEVLKRFTGSDAFGGSATIRARTSTLEPGLVPAEDLKLSWETFSDAADEAGMSRRYGGIHFEQGDLTGRAVGRLVGALAWDRGQAFITGSA